MKKILIITISILFGITTGYSQSIPTDKAMVPRTKGSDIQGFNDGFYPTNYHSRGFQWWLYSIKCPLAWEITKGSSDIWIGAAESLHGEVEHPDMANNFTLISNNYATNTQNIKKQSAGDSEPGYETSALRSGHGLITLSCAIAAENNGTDAPMVGVAPYCSGFYVSWYASINFRKIDVDGIMNNHISILDVIYQAADYQHHHSDLVHNGIVFTIGAGNSITSTSAQNLLKIYNPILGTSTYYYVPVNFFGSRSFFDNRYPNDVNKRIQPITVAGFQDGELFDNNCELWATTPPYSGPNHKGKEDFIATLNSATNYAKDKGLWVFSKGIDKFGDDTAKRNAAFVDLVVPASALFSAHHYWGMNDSYNNPYPQYMDGSGTSQGTAIAAGVAALMRSVSKYLLAEVEPISYKPMFPQDVHISAYKIMTFTADKLEDSGVLPDALPVGNGNMHPVANRFAVKDAQNRWVFGDDYEYDYKIQDNDALKRTWALRMGFGKLNAYRSVAHSIRNKGNYIYSLNSGINIMPGFQPTDPFGNPSGYVNPDGKQLLHFGAWIKDGHFDPNKVNPYVIGPFEISPNRGPTGLCDGILNVLEWGGTSLPGEYHNNQGVTRINSLPNNERCAMEVPENSILAIDGIICSDNPTSANYIISRKKGSKITIEGMIHNVEICGSIKVGDVIVKSTYESEQYGSVGCLSVSNGIDNTSVGDIYGRVIVEDLAEFYNWGTMTFHPGSSLILKGNKNFTLHGGSTTIFKSDTYVGGNQGDTIFLKHYATVIIDENATVVFDVPLRVSESANFVLMPGAVLHLNYVSSSGYFDAYNNSTIFFNCAKQHYLSRIDLYGDEIRFRSQSVENCYPHESPDYLDEFYDHNCVADVTCLSALYGSYDAQNVFVHQKIAKGEIMKRPFEILSISPNPVSDKFKVSYYLPDESEVRVAVLNILGVKTEIKTIHRLIGEQYEQIDLTNFPTGIYLLTISTNQGIKASKIIKK
jgi:hypothetical protein